VNLMIVDGGLRIERKSIRLGGWLSARSCGVTVG
jgi:hypothetical protein